MTHVHTFLSPSPAGHEAGDPDRCACGEWKPVHEHSWRRLTMTNGDTWRQCFGCGPTDIHSSEPTLGLA